MARQSNSRFWIEGMRRRVIPHHPPVRRSLQDQRSISCPDRIGLDLFPWLQTLLQPPELKNLALPWRVLHPWSHQLILPHDQVSPAPYPPSAPPPQILPE